MEGLETNVAGDLLRLDHVDELFVDLHALVGGEELSAGGALDVLHLEVHTLDVGVQPVLVHKLPGAGLARVGILLKMAMKILRRHLRSIKILMVVK